MLELMDNEFYAQNICLTGPMALILLFPSSEGVEEQNQNLTLCYGISCMYFTEHSRGPSRGMGNGGTR